MAAQGTGVTIGSRTIRVLEVRQQKKGGPWQVTKALIAPIGDPAAPDAKRVAEARGALKSAAPRGRALVGLTGKDLIVRYTQVPPVPDWRLEMLMNFEIQEVSEQSGGDVSAAYAQLGIDDATSGDNVVLVALAKNGHLEPRLAALREAGCDVLGGCPRAAAAFWAYKENAKLPADETVFLMHVGHENTDVAVARKGELVFARNVTGGSRMFTDAIMQNLRVDASTAEKMKVAKGNLTPRGKAKYRDSAEEKVANAMMGAAGHFVSAFNSSIMFAKAQTKIPDCQPSKLVLMGSGALLKGMPEYLESNLGIPVEVFDPMATVDLSALPEQTANALKQDQGGMAVTLGLAQMAADPDAFRVEVLPEGDRRRRRFMERTLLSIVAGVVLVAALAVAWTMLASASGRAKAEADAIAERQRRYTSNFAEFEAARKRVEEANRQKADLRRLVALGPAWQQVADVVHKVVGSGKSPSGGPDGFDEIYLPRMSAKFDKRAVQDASSGQTRFEFTPQVEFEAQVLAIGGRQPVQAYNDFVQALNAELEAKKGLKATFGQLDQNYRFKFSVQQIVTPEDVEARDRAAAAGEIR